ncbi:UNVERIFIED_CONTAM: hypothetical protein Slati_2675300 [Sesamum latifolium]|uniref:Retrotransposon gag domain-containing protein n=1 Tax=Sesamum latifolium TaxID=2727402 RepID=A0AAW2VZD5_9LAMI
MSDNVSRLTDAVDFKLENLKTDIRLVKKVVAGSGTEGGAIASKVGVQDLKSFGGEQSAKELKNFLWDMVTYFQAAKVLNKEKVPHNANRERIETWKVLKKELKDQFCPCKMSWVARESLRNLRCTGTVRGFVKELSSLMLDVRDMSEEDKLFNFMAGLQPWAQTKLRRQCVKDLPSTIAAADRLANFKVVNNPEQRQDDSGTARQSSTTTLRLGRFMWERCSWDRCRHSLVGGESRYKGLMMVAGQINGKEIKAPVDTGATNNFISDRVVHKLGLDVKLCDSQVKAVNSKAVPVSRVANPELRVVRGNKPTFVRREYDGDTTAGKKSKMIEAGPSKASSSKEGHISLIFPVFAVLGRCKRRWTEDGLRRSRFVELSLNHSRVQICLNACTLDSIASVGGRWHRHMRESADGSGTVGLCWCHDTGPVDGTCVRDIVGTVGSQQSGACIGEQTHVRDVRQAVRTRLRRLSGARAIGTECADDGNPRQAGRTVRMGSAQVQMGQTACTTRSAGRRGRLGGWLRGLRNGACAGHVMRRLRAASSLYFD